MQKIIYTTNAIESLNRVIRKPTKTRGSFPTDDAATKLIYLAIRSFEKAGRCVREWVAARNQFAICSIPDDHIDPRRSAFFMARSVFEDIRKEKRDARSTA